MIITETVLDDVFLIDLEPRNDARGYFVRTFCKEEFSEIAPGIEWVQINQAYNAKVGTLRGIHFQHPPFAEVKLVRCIAGAVYDVVVDLRKNSPTFLEWIGVELSADNQKMIYIPEGFGHGFQTLTDHTQLIYHHSAMFAPDSEGGLHYLDPIVAVKWPLEVTAISAKDRDRAFLPSNFKGLAVKSTEVSINGNL